jgi:hypothetical protein
MQRTENYRLFKPESTDNGSPEPFNNNADVIDAELNRLSTGLSRVDDALVAAQDVLESGITSAKVSKLDALPTTAELNTLFNRKQNTLTTKQMNAVNSGITSAKVSKLDALPTASKLEEEIASARGKELTATLTAGSTTLTFTDASITSDTIVDNVLTSVYGVIPEGMTISNGSLTLTFEEQATDIGVKVVIR